MSAKKLKLIGFLAVLLITGFVYYITLAPSLYWIDSAMYLSAVKEFGIAYTPGYPIYVILAKLWSFLPIPGLDFTKQVNFLTSIFASLSCGVLYLTILELFKNGFSFFKKNPSAQPNVNKPEQKIFSPKMEIIIAVLISLVFGFSYSLWFQAAYAEVYSLDVFLFGLAIYFAVLLTSEGMPDKILTDKQKKLWIGIVVAYGLSFANHPMTVALIPAMIWFAWQFKYPFKKNKNFFKLLAVIFLLSGFLPYIYMPIRSAQNPDRDWGNVETAGNFIRHVTSVVWMSDAAEFGSNKNIFSTFYKSFPLFYRNFYSFGLILAAIGVYFVRKNSKALFRFFLLAGGTAIFLGLAFTSGEYESWLIPGHYVIALFLSAGVFYISSEWKVSAKILVVILLFSIASSIEYNWYSLDRSHNYFPAEVGHNILKDVEDNAILLSEAGPITASIVYNQQILQEKPHVILIQAANMWLGWARENLKKYEKERGLVLPDIDMEIKNDGRSEGQQYFELNNKYLEALVVENIDKFPIYTDKVNSFLTASSSEKYGIELIPWGFGYKYIKSEEKNNFVFGGNGSSYSPHLWDFDFNVSRFCKFKTPNLRDLSFFECEYFGMNLQNGFGYKHPADLNIQSNNDFNTIRSGFSVSYMNLGDLYMKRKEYKKAIFYYNRAINLLTDNFDAEQKFRMYFQKGLALFYDEQYEKTIAYTYEVDKLYPKRSETAWILGSSFHKLGKNTEAFNIFVEAIKLFPKDEYLNNAFNIMLEENNKALTEAIKKQ